jgi:hypothetical protein
MTSKTNSSTVSFAQFLEQTEHRQIDTSTTRVESAPHAENASHTENIPDAENASDAKTVSHQKTASGALSASRAKRSTEPVLKVWDAENASHADSAPVGGHLRVPNEIIHRILPSLKSSEAIVLLRLYALSHGFQKKTCTVSLDKLASGCNLSRTQTRVCVRNLERKGHIKSLGIDNINSDKALRGFHFEVNLPSTTRAESAPHAKTASHAKSTPNKYKDLKEHTHTQEEPDSTNPPITAVEEKNDRATRGVGGGSRYTIEECRKYADHLHHTGQGITNPGGYATTIHRTGEADDLLDKFLHPELPRPVQISIDVKACPDCNGTGYWYPEGKDQGVKKCTHPRLLNKSVSDDDM